mgnify:CR=1 FL=1
MGWHFSGLDGTVTNALVVASKDRGWHSAVRRLFSSLKWRLDGSLFYDIEGGFLYQPSVLYKLNGDWTAEAFANIM